MLRLRPFSQTLWQIAFRDGSLIGLSVKTSSLWIAWLSEPHQLGGPTTATLGAIDEASMRF